MELKDTNLHYCYAFGCLKDVAERSKERRRMTSRRNLYSCGSLRMLRYQDSNKEKSDWILHQYGFVQDSPASLDNSKM